MVRNLEGVYRGGKIEIYLIPEDIPDETPVLVTFLSPGITDLRAKGIDEAHAADLRARLVTFRDDWESREMDSYDDSDAARAKL